MKYIYCLILCSLMSTMSKAQSCTKEVVATSTDWQQYDSNKRDYPNKWNWTLPGAIHDVYLSDNLSSPNFKIRLPYFCDIPASTGGCNNSNTSKYEVLSDNGLKQDIYPEDGWELIVKNFGNPATNTSTGNGVDNPYYLLYNKYTGRMKVFYAVIGAHTKNSAYLEIAFDQSSTRRAVFAHVTPITQTLEEFDPKNSFKVLNDFAEKVSPTAYYWLVGEVQTAYDPCTCSDNSTSLIRVRPYLVTTTDIAATIEGQVKQKLALANGGTTGENNGTTSFGTLATGAATAAAKSYTQFDGFRQKALEFFDGRNNAYKEKIIRDWWDKNASPNVPINQIEDKFKEFMKYPEDVKKLFGIEKLDDYKLLGKIPSGLVKGIASSLPYVGTAIGIIDFFINGGSKTGTTISPPLVFDASFKLTGTLTTTNPLPLILFNLPGSKVSSTSTLSPAYNRTLGVMNILKTPSMEFFDLKVNSVSVTNTRADLYTQCQQQKEKYQTGYAEAKLQAPKQFRLTEDVKYMLNPATNTEVDLIDACFVMEYKNDQSLFISSPNGYSGTTAIPLHAKVYDKTLSLSDRIKSIEESGWDLEYVSKDYPTAQGSIIRFRSKYMPLQCLQNLNFILWGANMPTMYVKMLVKLKRKDNPTAEQITQVLTYNMSNSLVKATKNPLEGSINHTLFANTITDETVRDCRNKSYTRSVYGNFDYSQATNNNFSINSLPLSNPYYRYPTNAVYSNNSSSNISVTGDITINDNNRVADNVILTALGNIYVGQGVTFGNNVQLIAGRKIDINVGTQITAGVSIRIQPSQPTDIFPCTNTNIAALQATATEIYSTPGKGCSAQLYKQSTIPPPPIKGEDVSSLKAQRTVTTSLTVAPNPFNTLLSVQYELQEPMQVTVSLSNALGQTVKVLVNQKVEAGSYQINESTADLPTGVYIVTMRTPTGMKTQKVVKQSN